MKRLLIVLILLFLSQGGFAVETTLNTFLRNTFGARPAALGGAFAAVDNDLNGVFYNPASLAGIGGVKINLSHIEFIMQTRYETVGAGFKIDGNTAAGISVSYINNGSQENRDAFGVVSGNFVPYQILVILSAAKKMNDGLSAGINIKLPYEVIDDYQDLKVLFDAGILLKSSESIDLGLSLQNFGTYNNLPLNIKTGLSYNLPGLKVLFDVNLPYKSGISLLGGVEIPLNNTVCIRMGTMYQFQEIFNIMSNITAGAGFNFNGFSLDYSIKSYNELGLTHFLAVSTSIL
jgi:hypothetical protein